MEETSRVRANILCNSIFTCNSVLTETRFWYELEEIGGVGTGEDYVGAHFVYFILWNTLALVVYC